MKLDITRKTDLAVRALHSLEKASRRLKGSEIAEEIEATTGFLPQVLAPLVKKGWVGSDPGPSGGYALLVELTKISVLDVIEAVEGPMDDTVCVLDGGHCNDDRHCAIHPAWSQAREQLQIELAKTPLSVATKR